MSTPAAFPLQEPSAEDRLVDLEARFAWLEKHVVEQDRAVLELTEELRRIQKEIQRIQKGFDPAPEPGRIHEEADERPPHY